MHSKRDIIALWVARDILPHEGKVRARLSRRWRGAIDVDDVIQEAYCRLAALPSVDHIHNPIAYFHRTAHAAAVDAVRLTKILPSMTENEWFDVLDERPSVEHAVEMAQELNRVSKVLATLSDTCKRVIELRRLEGMSQRETAERLGVSENVVENSIVRGIRQVLKIMADQDRDPVDDECGSNGVEREVVQIGKSRFH